MKYPFIVICLLVVSCTQNKPLNKESFIAPVRDYYQQYSKDIKSVDEVRIDSFVPITAKNLLEDSIIEKEKRYSFYVEAKDDEYADSTAREIEAMNARLTTAENARLLYYRVYHSVKFTRADRAPRKRTTYLDITSGLEVKPNVVTEADQLNGIKGEGQFKPYSY